MADSEPLVRVVAVPEAKETLDDVNDLVDLVQKQPGSYGMIVCVQTLFFTMIFMLFTVALDNDMQDQGLPSLVTIDLSKKAVTCKGGVPLTWKVGACTFFIGVACLEEVVRECDPASTDEQRRRRLSPPFAACERVVVGTYDIQHALLELRTETIEVLAKGMAFDYLQYKLKVFPTCLKGIAEVQERTRGRVVQRMFGESVEVDFDPDSHSETVRLTLKRS